VLGRVKGRVPVHFSIFPPMRRTLVVPDALLLGTLLAGLLLLSGCEGDYRPRAVGPIGEITVVMDSSHWTGPSGEALRANVTPWVETLPVSERSFQLRHLELTDERTYERVQDLKNVIIAAPLSDSTNETSFLRRRLSDEAEQAILDGQTAVVPKPNLWRRSQRIYYVAAASPDALAETFQSQGTQIRDTFTEATLQRMDRNMYEDDRRSALEDTLMQRHGFAVNMQSDFQIAVDTTTGSEGFVWPRPDRKGSSGCGVFSPRRDASSSSTTLRTSVPTRSPPSGSTTPATRSRVATYGATSGGLQRSTTGAPWRPNSARSWTGTRTTRGASGTWSPRSVGATSFAPSGVGGRS